jgi:hypothetical protein
LLCGVVALVGLLAWLVYSSQACGCSIAWATEAKTLALHTYDTVLACREDGGKPADCGDEDIVKLEPSLAGEHVRNHVRVVDTATGWRVEAQIRERHEFDGAFFVIEGKRGVTHEHAKKSCFVTDRKYRYMCPDGTW